MTVVSAGAVAARDVARDAASAREAAFLHVYGAEYPALAAYCWRLTNNSDVAADLAQEAFTRLLARWITVREPRAYVYHVATNLARRHWRQQARAARAAMPDTDDTSPADDGLHVRLAVGQLPLRLRDVVLLHYYADLSVNDVAEAVQRPVGTVKRQLAEARAALSKRLERGDG